MRETRTVVKDLRRLLAEIRVMVVLSQTSSRKLRDAVYDLEVAIHGMERALTESSHQD